MAPLRLNSPARLTGIFLLPFRNNVKVGLDFKQALENEWKALRGRVLQREDFDVIVVESQMPTMAFEMRVTKVVVEEGVVFGLSLVELFGSEIEGALKNAEGFLLVEKPNCQEVADLEYETLGLLQERGGNRRACYGEFE